MNARTMMIMAVKHYINGLMWAREHVDEESYHFFDNDLSLCNLLLADLQDVHKTFSLKPYPPESHEGGVTQRPE